MLVTRYQVPGRPTCLTVVGRRSPPTKVETAAEAMVVEPAEPMKEKKKKQKGKADRRTTSTSGNLGFRRIYESRTTFEGPLVLFCYFFFDGVLKQVLIHFRRQLCCLPLLHP